MSHFDYQFHASNNHGTASILIQAITAHTKGDPQEMKHRMPTGYFYCVGYAGGLPKDGTFVLIDVSDVLGWPPRTIFSPIIAEGQKAHWV